MGRISYLTKRGAVYYARMDVPLDLVPTLGVKTKKKTLDTKDEAEAKRRLRPVIDEWTREFDDIRARRVLVTADREHAVWDHYTAVLRRDEAEREGRPSDVQVETARRKLIEKAQRGEIDAANKLQILDVTLELQCMERSASLSEDARRFKLSDLRKHLAKGEMALIAHEVEAYLKQNNLFIERSTPEWVSLARRMMRAEIEALERTLERDRGDYSGQPRDPLIKVPTVARRDQETNAAPGEGIQELVEVFRQENPRKVSAGRMNESCRDIGKFIEVIGSRFSVDQITKRHVRDWKALLLKYPLRATEVTAFKGMNILQIVKENETLGRDILSDRTVNRYISSLSAFFSWAVSNDYMQRNPCEGMALPKVVGNRVLSFSVDQMNVLFHSPLFIGAVSASEWRNIAKSGPVKIRDHRFWVPLIMAFSGARPGEIGQLAVNDIRKEHGHWIMHITTEGDSHAEGKSVKTAGSMRVVPIHPELIELGFLEYRSKRVEGRDKQLFPGAHRNERGQMMADFSREFGKYLTRIGIKNGRGISLYSFRHGAADALRRAGHLDDQFGFLLGHTKSSMTGRYGNLPQGMLERMRRLRPIDFRGSSARPERRVFF